MKRYNWQGDCTCFKEITSHDSLSVALIRGQCREMDEVDHRLTLCLILGVLLCLEGKRLKSREKRVWERGGDTKKTEGEEKRKIYRAQYQDTKNNSQPGRRKRQINVPFIQQTKTINI